MPTMAEGDQRRPGRGGVDVEDLLGQPLADFHRRVLQREDVHSRRGEEPEDRQDVAAAHDAPGGEEIWCHSSTTAGKTRMHRVTKTISNSVE